MPIVLRANGFKVTIRHPPREHGPPHVHVFSGDAECELWIGSEEIGVKAIHGMRASDGRDALQIVADNVDLLLGEWRRLHGPKGSKGK
ncbi:MAG: DUF4160 domain-containing protein [Gemmatimonadaceae bacterium]